MIIQPIVEGHGEVGAVGWELDRPNPAQTYLRCCHTLEASYFDCVAPVKRALLMSSIGKAA